MENGLFPHLLSNILEILKLLIVIQAIIKENINIILAHMYVEGEQAAQSIKPRLTSNPKYQ